MASSLAATALFPACAKKEGAKKDISIAVFIPGIIADSPTYAHVAEGVTKAVDSFNSGKGDSKSTNGGRANLYVMEAGTNQAEWSTKLTALAAEGIYDVIISSNPSMPALASPIAKQFPEQKFIFLDAALEEGSKEEQIYCISYNQRDQAYVSGYIAGLYSSTNKVGLIAAQEYPIMNNIL
ncbi:MAG: BMP family ABC transporter substrate-binding protein, partial [Treponema sp.]|nr:BMP family ABC transporter substrate-binding protein [Treponema sp.]